MKVVAGLILVLALIFCAYFLGKNSTPTKLPPPSIVTTSSTSPIPTTIIVSNTPPPVSVKLLPTTNWDTATNKIFSLKYPTDTFSATTADNYIQLRWKNNSGNLMDNSPDFLVADNYYGGSRQNWYLNYFNFRTNEVVFTEKMLGKLSVLETKPKSAITTRDILITHGNTLIDVMLQGANLTLVETIVSTIVFK